jgi:DNA-binding NarL/FixJ family response regulator
LIARGLSDQDVAQELGISIHTARRHAGQILSKLGLSSRAGVAVALLQATA